MAMSADQQAIDTRAIELAMKALTTIELHEKTCEQRWGHVAEKLGELNTNVGGLYSRMWGIAASVIVILLGIVGFLLARHGI